MRKISKRFALAICFILLAILLRAELIGLGLSAYLELKLSYLMGVKVNISGLAVDPFSGRVTARQVYIGNPKRFSSRPHLKAEVEAVLDMKALRDKQIIMKSLILRDIYFLIERNSEKDPTVTNIKVWIAHVREKKANKNDGPENRAGKKWRVAIERGIIENGSFVFENRAGENIKKLYTFQNLYGTIEGFDWPTPIPEELPETVRMKGTIGTTPPAALQINGRSNFASRGIDFDLKGEIRGGGMVDYKFFFKGSPLKVTGGEYDLDAHAVCRARELKWENDLVMRDLRLKPKSAVSLIRGLPTLGYIRFLESQKSIALKVPIEGNITNPETRPEFGKAFQQSLNRYAEASKDLITAPVKKVAEPVGALAEKPVKAVGETLGKAAELIGMKPAEDKEPEKADNGTPAPERQELKTIMVKAG